MRLPLPTDVLRAKNAFKLCTAAKAITDSSKIAMATENSGLR